MTRSICKEAKAYLEHLQRIYQFTDNDQTTDLVFLLPKGVDYEVYDDSEIITKGLSQECDTKKRDLINVILPKNPLKLEYLNTNVLTPLVYAESLSEILWHITTQAILFTRATRSLISWIRRTQQRVKYGKHEMDHFWLKCSKSIDELNVGEYICIFNRRVNGWDGSIDCPVIELLGTGGHLPVIWNENNKEFRALSFIENIQKEAAEELGISVPQEKVHIFGGYSNDITHEMVVLSGVEIDAKQVPIIESYAIQNIDLDTMGIYMGTFSEVIEYYRQFPRYFAGGYRAALTNFPFQSELMKIVTDYLTTKGVIER